MNRGERVDYVLGRDDCKSCASLRDFNIKYGHKSVRYSSLAQSVERMTVNHDVAGSSPAGGAIAPLAQLVEQLTLNQWVPGSNP